MVLPSCRFNYTIRREDHQVCLEARRWAAVGCSPSWPWRGYKEPHRYAWAVAASTARRLTVATSATATRLMGLLARHATAAHQEKVRGAIRRPGGCEHIFEVVGWQRYDLDGCQQAAVRTAARSEPCERRLWRKFSCAYKWRYRIRTSRLRS